MAHDFLVLSAHLWGL